MPNKPELRKQFDLLTAEGRVRALSEAEVHQLKFLREVLAELDAKSSTKVVLVSLSAADEQVAVVEALRQAGIRVETPPASATPTIAVVDTGTALAFAGAPLVLLNASGPDALMGQLLRLKPAAFIKRRAPVAEVLDAVKALLAATA